MNPQVPSPNPAAPLAKADPKCHHVTVSGRQCRLRAIRSGLCFRHAALQLQSTQPVDVDLSSDFLGQLDDLQSAEQINQFLAKLLALVVQNRISPRRAAVLTYITNQLLHSLVAIKRELDSEPPKSIGLVGPEPTTHSQTLWHTAPGRSSALRDCRASGAIAWYHDPGAIAPVASGCKMGTRAETQPSSPVSKGM